jgi:nicotinamidase-related amidase
MGRLKGNIDSSAVHLCTDMQGLFSSHGPWPTPWMERVLPIVVGIVERSPARTIFTRFIPPRTPDDAHGKWRDYFTKWSEVTRDTVAAEQLELMPALRRFVPPALVFDKRTYSAFADGTLHSFLRGRHVDTVIISGAETDVCVLSTVLAAVDLGYRVLVVEDAICSSSDASHDALLGLYRMRFDLQVELASVDEICDYWRG